MARLTAKLTLVWPGRPGRAGVYRAHISVPNIYRGSVREPLSLCIPAVIMVALDPVYMYLLSHDGKLDNAVHPACALIHTPAPVILRLWEEI